MSNGRTHAYGKGSIYKKPKINVGAFFIGIVFKIIDSLQAQKVWQVFDKNSVVGKNCFLGLNAWCTNYGSRETISLGDSVYCRGIIRCGSRGAGKVKIGSNVYIGDSSIISSESSIEIGDFTMISHGVHIFDTIGHPTDYAMREKDWLIITKQIEDTERPTVPTAPIKIGRNVWVGFNAIIMKGVTIGDGAVIGAGTVVVDDIAAGSVVVGNPARVVNKDKG